ETSFYHYSVMFYCCLGLWLGAALIASIYNDPSYERTVTNVYYLLVPFGNLAIAFLIGAAESVKSETRTALYNVSFVVAGGLIVGLYFPEALDLVLLNSVWVSTYSQLYQIGRGILFLICVLSLLPLTFRIGQRVKSALKGETLIQVLVVLIAIIGPAILMGQIIVTTNPDGGMLFIHPGVFIAGIILFLLLMMLIFVYHPTVLFAFNNDVLELYIVERDSGLPLYHFDFKTREDPPRQEILTAFFTSIRHFLKQSLEAGEIERVRFGANEVVVGEGMMTYGMLISNRGSDLLSSLLAIVVTEFEVRYAYQLSDPIRPNRFKAFDEEVLKYFEFAALDIEENNIAGEDESVVAPTHLK
ncbi:MAG: hypothetical protein RTU92_03040, partial [Candidatus Thorarchaeota archaeon]